MNLSNSAIAEDGRNYFRVEGQLLESTPQLRLWQNPARIRGPAEPLSRLQSLLP